MHVEVTVNQESTALLADAGRMSYETIQEMFHVPYQFVLAKNKKPPKIGVVESLICGGVLNMIILALMVVGLYCIILICWFPARAWRLIDV